MKNRRLTPGETHSELLILADGSILTHNMTPAMATLLVALDPADAAMRQRAGMGESSSAVPLVHVPTISSSL